MISLWGKCSLDEVPRETTVASRRWRMTLMENKDRRSGVEISVNEYPTGYQISIAGVFWHYADSLDDAVQFIERAAPVIREAILRTDDIATHTLGREDSCQEGK